jgi:excisionase family DNA binding protein
MPRGRASATLLPVTWSAAPPPLLEVAQVAHRYNFSPETIRRMIRSGELPARRIHGRWRITEADAQAWYDRHSPPMPDRRVLAPATPDRRLTPRTVFPHEVSR